MVTIVHMTQRNKWEKACELGSYKADSLYTQGFIHCSTPEQIVPVANFIFKGQNDLVLLIIDTTKIDAKIKYENLEGGTELFPHVYGPLPVASISYVLDFPPQADGSFVLPESLLKI